MAIMITCVGNTDPIRARHDGPILHIARSYRPDKILLIHSEHSKQKHDAVVEALMSIEGYTPEIMVHDEIIKDSDIYVFDKVFNIFNNILEEYTNTEEEVFLNLSSATPQVKSAMFTLNRLNDLNVRAFQVISPVHGSNEDMSHDNDKPIEFLIENNLDNVPDYESRIEEDSGISLKKLINLNTYRDLLKHYNYEAIYRLSCKDNLVSAKLPVFGKENMKFNTALEAIVSSIKTQNLLPSVESLTIPMEQKRLLNAWLLLNLQAKRELVGEFLMRLKNIAEYGAEMYLEKKYPGTLEFREGKPYLKDPHGELAQHLNTLLEKAHNDKRSKTDFERVYLNLAFYVDIIKYYDENDKLLGPLKSILGTGGKRNKLAHGLEVVEKERNYNRYVQDSFLVIRELLSLSEEEWKVFSNIEKQEIFLNSKNRKIFRTKAESYFDRLNEKLFKFLK